MRSPTTTPHRPSPAGRSTALRGGAAFTRIECVMVFAGILLMTLVSIPTLGGFRGVGDRQQCSAHFRQLTRAWLLYAEDNAGRLPGNLDGGDAMDPRNTNRTWAVGWLDFSNRPDNTNTVHLGNSQLGAYLGSVSVFRCPADPSLSRGRTGDPRVRSVSMNSYVGQRAQPYSSGYRQFLSLASIVGPRPSECLVFMEEREDSINDGCFFIDMASYEPSRPSAYTWVDYPSARHDGGGTMSFADGHVETWRWNDIRTVPVLRFGQPLPLNLPSPNNPDVGRVQASASRRNN